MSRTFPTVTSVQPAAGSAASGTHVPISSSVTSGPRSAANTINAVAAKADLATEKVDIRICSQNGYVPWRVLQSET